MKTASPIYVFLSAVLCSLCVQTHAQRATRSVEHLMHRNQGDRSTTIIGDPYGWNNKPAEFNPWKDEDDQARKDAASKKSEFDRWYEIDELRNELNNPEQFIAVIAHSPERSKDNSIHLCKISNDSAPALSPSIIGELENQLVAKTPALAGATLSAGPCSAQRRASALVFQAREFTYANFDALKGVLRKLKQGKASLFTPNPLSSTDETETLSFPAATPTTLPPEPQAESAFEAPAETAAEQPPSANPISSEESARPQTTTVAPTLDDKINRAISGFLQSAIETGKKLVGASN